MQFKIVINLNGGLGNQMFQYAFARSLSIDLGANLYIDDTNLSGHAVTREYTLNIFKNIKKDLLVDNGRTLNLSNFESIFDDTYYENVLNSIKNEIGKFDTLFINGYFQSIKLFHNNESEIRKDFHINPIKIETDKTPVVLQVRRGDFVGNPFHEICNIDYYNKSIQKIKELVEDPIFIIISEDTKWVSENINFDGCEFFENPSTTELGDYEVMLSCEYHIISNSSFGWWPAFLSIPKVVIAPNRWYANGIQSELIQLNWITIET
jgi:hypothetical protein